MIFVGLYIYFQTECSEKTKSREVVTNYHTQTYTISFEENFKLTNHMSTWYTSFFYKFVCHFCIYVKIDMFVGCQKNIKGRIECSRIIIL